MFFTTSVSRWQLLIANVAALLLLSVINVRAQSSAITYQGRLTDAGAAADSIYDFEFRLFDSNGVQIGPVITREDVTVVKGIFTTTLDFGTQAFDGTERSLEIAVRPGASTDAFTTLAPRQPVTSTPYALRTLSAAKADSADSAASTTDSQKLGGIAAGQYVRTDDPRLVGGPPAPGSPNYIQNGTAPQAASFNVSGNGIVGGTVAANIVSAGTQFNIGGDRVLKATDNLTSVGIGAGAPPANIVSNSFFGKNAGQNTTKPANSFFGSSAGKSNTVGDENSFFGSGAGSLNVDGASNSAFGSRAGVANVSGSFNAFFGAQTGLRTLSSGNSFFGYSAGLVNKFGANNTFVGLGAGNHSTSGNGNTFLGANAGSENTTESGNTLIGFKAEVAAGISSATAIGNKAMVTQRNSLVLGAVQGVNGAQTSTKVGIGTTAPGYRLEVSDGDIGITSPGHGIFLKSDNGLVCALISLTNGGVLVTARVRCP